MAAIASTRIASGGGIFHKPQANDANSASGTDAPSPFQQILSTTAAGTSAVPSAQDQGTPGQRDSSKKSGKDSKADSKTDPSKANQSQQNAVVAAADSKTLIQASTANDDGQDDAGAIDPRSSGATTGQDTGTTAGQASDPSAQQIAADASQTLAAAQLSVPAQDTQDANKSGTGANDGGNAGATLLDSIVNKSAAPTQTASADDAATSSVSVTDTSSDTSKSGKAKRDAQDAASAQIQAKDASAQINSTTQSSAPAAKKDHKSAKTGDQGNSTAPTVQATPPNSVVAMAASVPPLPTASATANDTDTDASDAIAAAATGQAKSGQTKPNSNSNPPAGAKPAALNDQVAADASNSPSASGALSSPASASTAAQDGSPAQGSNASQSADNKSAVSAGDNQTSAAPAQPQIQAAQPQPQPQAGILPAVQPQQAHTGATDSVTQNVQLAQSDSTANANTVSALAVAIAARSQSGNKQFDIRLDPPELGRVEVRLSIDATGKAQASLSADQPRTLDLLKTDAPALTRALRDAGLNVSQNGLNFSLRGQDRQNGGNGFTPRSGRSAQTSLIATSAIGAVQGGANYQGPANGHLDIRV